MWGVFAEKGTAYAGQARGLPRLGAEHVRYTLLLRCHARRRRQAVARRALGLVGAGCRWLAGGGAGRHLAERARLRQLQHRRQLDPATVPTGTAFFGTSATTALSISTDTTIGGWTFNAGASAYSFTNGQNLAFHRRRHRHQRRQRHHHQQLATGFQHHQHGRQRHHHQQQHPDFSDTSTAGSATITNNGNPWISTTAARPAAPPSPTTRR